MLYECGLSHGRVKTNINSFEPQLTTGNKPWKMKLIKLKTEFVIKERGGSPSASDLQSHDERSHGNNSFPIRLASPDIFFQFSQVGSIFFLWDPCTEYCMEDCIYYFI